MIIRNMAVSDKERILEITKEVMQTYPVQVRIEMDEESISKMVEVGTTSNDIVALVVEVDGVVQGMFYAVVFPHPFNNSFKVADVISWWVRPAFRGRAGVELLNTAERLLKEAGADMSVIKYFIDEEFSPDQTERYLIRKGYRPVEIMTAKVLT